MEPELFLKKCYVHNIIITNLIWQAIISEQKCDINIISKL